jgi:hypothetical protein
VFNGIEIMLNNEFESIVELKIRDIIALVINQNQLVFEDAIQYVYESELFHVLTNEATKLWHLSAFKLYEILIDEKKNNRLILPDYV